MRPWSLLLPGLVSLGLIGFRTDLAAQVSLVPAGAVWQFLDTGVDPGDSWNLNAFQPTGWKSGPAPLGYGNGDEATTIATGIVPRPWTVYFRHAFVLPDPPAISALTLRVVNDDGAIIYLNGTEIYRRNLPAGSVTNQTPANAIVDGFAESVFIQRAAPSYLIRPGTNLLAVELHQHPAGLFDARFDLELIGNLPLTLPEVRITSPISGTILTSGSVPFFVQASDLDGSISSVRYYANGERIGENFSEPFDILWSSVPIGRYRLVAEAVDNSGRRRESAPVYFQMGTVTGTRVIRGPYLQSCSTTGIVVCWRTDWPSDSTVRYGPGLGDLDFVARGTPGVDHAVRLTGLVPETTYVYTVGDESGPAQGGAGWDFHFTTATDRTKPVRIWAIGDSGQTNDAARAVRDAYRDWVGEGPTDVWLMLGDNAYEEGKDDEYQHAVFEQYPMLLRNGHYGFSSNLVASMILDGTSGHPDEGPYRKPAGGLGANQGTAYVVCGCSGEGGSFQFRRHPAMFANLAGFGSMVIDVNGQRMDVQFLTDQGTIGDWFAIDKSAPEPLVRPRLAIRTQPASGGIGIGADGVELAWPTSSLGFQLESRVAVGPGSAWEPIAENPELHGRTYRVRQDTSGTNRIYRLRSVR